MSTTLPVTFRVAPIAPGFRGKLSEYEADLISRLAIQSDTNFSLFTTGSTLPTSNIGPFLKDGQIWYVWSSGTGSYIPLVLEYQSLKYIAKKTSEPPSNTYYTLWIELDDATGQKAISLNYWNAATNQWESVYKDALDSKVGSTDLSTAIAVQAGADAAARNMGPFRARKSAAAQGYTAGTGDSVIVYDAEDFDVSNAFGSNKFTAPADGYWQFHASIMLTLDTGTPTAIDRVLKLRLNGAVVAINRIQVSDETGAGMITISAILDLAQGDEVDVALNVSTTGASTWIIANNSTTTYFNGHKILIQ